MVGLLLRNNDRSVDDVGYQGSVNGRWSVNDNWCRSLVLNWRQNSGPLRFRGCRLNWSGSLILDWCRWSLDWHQIGEHDREHLLDPETDNLSSQRIQVDVTSGLENVLPNDSLSIQQ